MSLRIRRRKPDLRGAFAAVATRSREGDPQTQPHPGGALCGSVEAPMPVRARWRRQLDDAIDPLQRRSVLVLRQPEFKLGNGQRLAEVVALCFIATLGLEKVLLRLGFNALGYDLETQAAGH